MSFSYLRLTLGHILSKEVVGEISCIKLFLPLVVVVCFLGEAERIYCT